MSEVPPRIALLPRSDDDMAAAIAAGGGALAAPGDADAIVWTDPGDPEALRSTLESSPATWVQLPFAGIERFVAAGVIDPARTWTCAKVIYGHSTGEHALALMLAAARCLHTHVKAQTWRGQTRAGRPERQLKGAEIVLVGAGGIARELTRMLEPLQARVTVVSRSGRTVEGAAGSARTEELHEVLPGADFVVVAAALTDETRGLIGRAALGAMGKGAWLVNVARGGLVDTDALVEALREGSIAGAALDVTDPEPLPDGHPLWSLDNAIITPHVANTWDMALPELRAMVRRNVEAFATGRPLEGLVDPVLGY